MSATGVRLVLRLPHGEDVALRNAAARSVESEPRLRSAAVRRFAVELLEEWADQERREADVRGRVQAIGSHPVRALLAVAAELREVEGELRVLDFGPAGQLADELLVLAGELAAAITAVRPTE